ncbi:sterol desaturase family protein [Chitinimonas lacunae]|uniref:Sterol desaturase family protein n=1 Tax=Chitinimonas lacunae TaxID=1963018 RepID=A0ABV8MT50_9NEIS
MDHQLIAYAAPLFVVLIGLELLAAHYRGRDGYRINDAISSISLGVLSTGLGVFTGGLMVLAYWLIQQSLPWSLPADHWGTWLLALIGYDFLYYWHHRLGHQVNILWAAHVVHHQSEEYNLSTALRQSGSTWLLGWVFYLPLALCGVPLTVYLSAATINLLYQFWIHTRHIGSLGWFDRWFSSPSNHRVHHGSNDRYLDRNFGGISMLWDRLFGTFQPELAEEPVIYGIRSPLRSWNPLWANLHYYCELIRLSRATRRWGDRWRLWWRAPGWLPADLADSKRLDDPRLHAKYDPPLPAGLARYLLWQFALAYLAGLHFLAGVAARGQMANIAYGAALGLTLWIIGGLLERRPPYAALEWARLGGIGLWLALSSALAPAWQLAGFAVLAVTLWCWLRVAAQASSGLQDSASSGSGASP